MVGEAATALFKDAQAMLARIIDEKLFTARGVVGLWPAQRRGEDDIVVFSEDRSAELAVLHQLRQQTDKPNDQPNYSLADFVAPEGSVDDYVGAFVVTAGIEAEKLAHSYDAKHDDYNSILIKALADRFAEAFAERLHEIVRKELWGYAADEQLSNEELIKENLQRHPSGTGLSGLPGSHRESHPVPHSECRTGDRRVADRELRHDPGRLGQWLVFLTSGGQILRTGQNRP